jgi:hypothetical protein
MSGVNACIFAGVVEYPRHRARPTLTPRARMWGVVFRIAAAAAAIAVVQHHVTQVYEAWRADDEANAARREAGPTKRLEEGPRANANDDDATPPASGPVGPRADGGRGGAGAPRAFAAASAVAALSAASTRPGPRAAVGARGAVDPRSVRSALNAARRVLR